MWFSSTAVFSLRVDSGPLSLIAATLYGASVTGQAKRRRMLPPVPCLASSTHWQEMVRSPARKTPSGVGQAQALSRGADQGVSTRLEAMRKHPIPAPLSNAEPIDVVRT